MLSMISMFFYVFMYFILNYVGIFKDNNFISMAAIPFKIAVYMQSFVISFIDIVKENNDTKSLAISLCAIAVISITDMFLDINKLILKKNQ